jgi:hypothetical protein
MALDLVFIIPAAPMVAMLLLVGCVVAILRQPAVGSALF